jgi:uncharacterized membrane protein YhaH (DUF805 family)
MTLQESIRTCFTKYANFDGCASRSEYWWWILFYLLGILGLDYFSKTLAGLFVLATLLPTVAVATRRLHDTNRSGWWQLVGLIPYVGGHRLARHSRSG